MIVEGNFTENVEGNFKEDIEGNLRRWSLGITGGVATHRGEYYRILFRLYIGGLMLIKADHSGKMVWICLDQTRSGLYDHFGKNGLDLHFVY